VGIPGSAASDIVRWLVSPAAEDGLRRATVLLDAHRGDPLAAGAALRRERPDLDPGQAAATLEQAALRRLAAERYGLTADRLLLTRHGLEQATRPSIARRRARLLHEAGARRVLDLTGGLGFDTIAMLSAGLDVTALEADATTALLLAHNAPLATVVRADATADGALADLLADLGPQDVVFADPARRDPAGPRDPATGRARPERDPARWSPPWPFVAALPHPRIAAKVAPAFRPPDGWRAEWISVDRTVVECSLFSWSAFDPPRRAVLLHGGEERVIADARGESLPIAQALGIWVHEPDPAVVRAHALAGLLVECPDLASVDAHSGWLTGNSPSPSGLGLRSYRVLADIAGSAKEQRRLLAEHGVRSLTVKCRDVEAEPRTVLRNLGLREGGGHVLVMTRRGGRALSLLVSAAERRSD
jgi:hypothetical protein